MIKPIVSRTLIINTLCCGIGALLAGNIYWIARYWSVVRSIPGEVFRCLDEVSRWSN